MDSLALEISERVTEKYWSEGMFWTSASTANRFWEKSNPRNKKIQGLISFSLILIFSLSSAYLLHAISLVRL